MSNQTAKKTPIGEVIRDIMKGRNELAEMINLNANFTVGVLDELILVPLTRLAKIDKENQKTAQ